MRIFIKNLIIFFLPIIIIAIGFEVLLRKIPNDYVYKNNYLNKNSGNLQVLILGNSHSYYGIDPEYIKLKSFNAAYVSQSIDYDWKILEKYDKKLNSLKFIIVPVDYVTLYSKVGEGPESWRTTDYNIYYELSDDKSIKHNSEILARKLVANLTRLIRYYLLHKSEITSSSLGWGTGYRLKNQKDLLGTGIGTAQRHTAGNSIFFKEEAGILKSIIAYAKKRNIKLLLYTSPAYKSYVQNLKEDQLVPTIGMATTLAKENKNVFYYNFLDDRSFNAMDFYDGDHLDEFGAKKLTKKIDSLLTTLKP